MRCAVGFLYRVFFFKVKYRKEVLTKLILLIKSIICRHICQSENNLEPPKSRCSLCIDVPKTITLIKPTLHPPLHLSPHRPSFHRRWRLPRSTVFPSSTPIANVRTSMCLLCTLWRFMVSRIGGEHTHTKTGANVLRHEDAPRRMVLTKSARKHSRRAELSVWNDAHVVLLPC